MNTEEQIKALAEAQRKKTLTDLATKRDASLSPIKAEETMIKPAYQQQRQTTNAQSQLGAKNFAEYLANRGLSNSGISAQAELSRNNTLANNINTINTNETNALNDINRRMTDVNNAYQSDIASANAGIDIELGQNLINNRQAEQERQDRLKQQEFANNLDLEQLAIAKYNAYKKDEQQLPEGMTFAQNGTAYQVLNGKVVPIQYAVKSTTKDLNGKTTTQYENQKQYDYNKQGYWLNNNANKIKFGTKKTSLYTPWFNQYDNNNYIIAYDIPLPITGNEKDGREVISNAYKSGAITKEQLKKLTDKFGY